MPNPRLRSDKKWEAQFKIVSDLFYLSEQYKDDVYLLQEYAKAIRNPVVFDNQVKETNCLLDYTIPNIDNDKTTPDHLIGMSNIVLYIIKSKLYQKWKTPDDFKKTLKALQVTIICPKKLNNSKVFKDWVFKYDDIESSIHWASKLKKNNIEFLLDKDGNQISVDRVWSEWFFINKSYL
ncbi:MAG: hypothetical protein ACOC3V_01070 [bacterium]